MSNSLLDLWRKNLADAGTPDDREDADIMYSELIPLAQQNPDLLTQYPDFAKDFGQYREANAPSLTSEFGRALKAGTEETGATYAGLGAIAGIPGAQDAAKSLEEDAAGNQPTIASMDDIAPGESGLGKFFSKDTARYVAQKAGGALPGLAEMAGLAVTGAAVGSAVEPGVGTIAGAGEGVVEELLGKGIIKSAIKSLVEEGVADKLVESKILEEPTEAAIKKAVLGGDQKVADLITSQAKSLAAGRSEALTNFANVYGMSAGGIYNETGNRDAALGLGAVSAITAAPPFLSLPARVVRGLFPKLSTEAAQAAAKDLVGQKSSELLAKLGRAGSAAAVGTGGVLGMEAANIVAKNLTAGKDPLELDDADWKRLREAAVGGAIASAPFAALAARSPTVSPDIAPQTQGGDNMQPNSDALERSEGLTAARNAPEPAAGAATPTLDIMRRVSAYTPDESRARLRQLTADTQRDENDEKEYQVLRANAPSDALSPAPPTPETPPQSTAAPAAVPPVVEVAAPESEASEMATFKDAGFDSQDAFDKAYEEQHEKEAFETEDEFTRRLFCQGQAA